MGASVMPETDPVQTYLAKYGRGGQGQAPAPEPPPSRSLHDRIFGDPVSEQSLSDLVTGRGGQVETADPVQSYLAKYGKPKFNPGSGAAGGGESILQGLLGGFADEIGGAGSAAIDTASDIFHGRPTQFKKNYEETRDVARALDKGFEEAHPVGHAAAEIVGSLPWLAVGAGAAGEGAEAANLASRVRSGIQSGVKIGSIYGAGNAEGGVGQRLKGAIVGGVEGGAVGSLAPAVGAALSHVPKVLQAMTGIGTKEVAIQKLAEVLREAGISVPEFEQRALSLKKAGAPVVAGEIPGDLGREQIEFVTGQPSAKGLALGTKLSERHEGQYDRIMTGLKDATGSDFINVPHTEDELIAAQRAHAQPNYEAAYASGPFDSPNLQAARKIPEFQKALEVGQKLAYHDDVLQAMKSGKPVPPPPAPAVADGAALGVKAAGGGLPAAAEAPAGVSIKALDYAKRYLDHVISGGAESGSSFSRTSAQTTSGLLKQILGEVDSSNPAYAKARSIYAGDARIREVLDQAKGAVNMNPDDLTAWAKTLTPDEMSLAQKRFISELRAKAGNVNDRNDLTKQFLQNPNMRQRFQAMFPDQNTMETLGALKEREAGMARTHTMANTGSRTAPRLATNESNESVIGPADIGVGLISPRRAGMRLIGDAGQLVHRQTKKALADALAPLLSAEPGTPEWDQLVRALKSQGKGMNALADNHHFLHALARTFAGSPSQNQAP